MVDWFSRKVLAWRLSITMDTAFCIEAVGDALAKHGRPAIFGSDQGSQFTSVAFTDLLKKHEIAISMDGKGAWRDNVFVERLWRTRDCAWCGTEFQPATPDAETCSIACAAEHQELKAGRALADRNCANPKCGKLFHPIADRVKFCSIACHRENQADTLPTRLCAYEACGKPFQPRQAVTKFCSAACRKADLKGRTLEPKPCAACGVEFAPKKASVIFCGKSCASRTRVERAKASAFRCEGVTEYREAAE